MIALCSGGFSVLHVGHLELFETASAYGDVIVALNSDEWLRRKYGTVIVPWNERMRLLRSLKMIHDVTYVQDDDSTVCEAIRRIRPDFFVNGGDRKQAEPREHSICVKLGVVEIFKGEKIQSSSSILRMNRQ